MSAQGHTSTRRVALPSLEITNNWDMSYKAHPLVKSVTSIGHDPQDDIFIDQNFVSRSHLRIERMGNQFYLKHADRRPSTNGLWYEGRYIQGDEEFRKPLVHGDIFRIGDERGQLITFRFDDGSEQDVQSKIQEIKLGAPELSIGRSPDNTIMLDHPQVSAHHARLVKGPGTYRIEDLHSTNHVYVNGQAVTHRDLDRKDEIRIGPYKFIFFPQRLLQTNESCGIQIEARDLVRYGTKKKVLLQDISLVIPPRKFVALLGGSGAGKSTLLKALNGYAPANKGNVLYNGEDYYKSLSAFSTQLGYVPQDDIVHRDLTVKRALYYAAKMRLPKDLTHPEIIQRVEEVLKEVELSEEKHKLPIHQLSGGQRKRVSIALELLASPSIFFLDEPTSGLDPGLDHTMMHLLRKLADKGHTIVLVTHAVSNINLCDYVCFLAPGGYLAYFGPPQGACVYFNRNDFGAIYTLLEPTEQDRDIPKRAGERFKRHLQTTANAQPQLVTTLTAGKKNKRKRPKQSFWRQFGLLTHRYIELIRNDWGNLLILLLQAPIIGIILVFLILGVGSGGFDPKQVIQCPTTSQVITATGAPDPPTLSNPPTSKSCSNLEHFLTTNPRGKAYAASRGGVTAALQDFIVPGPGDAPTILFIIAFASVMFGSINAAREVVKELPIYERERAVSLRIFPYLFSKIAVLGAFCLFQSALLVAFIEAVDPFQQSILLYPPLEVYITVALTSLTGLMAGLTISSLVNNTDRAMSFIPIILLPQVVFAGTLFPLTNSVMQIVGFFFPMRWAMLALGSTVGLHSDKINGDELYGSEPTFHSTLFSTYSHAQAVHYLLLSWAVLGGFIVVLTISLGVLMKRKDRHK